MTGHHILHLFHMPWYSSQAKIISLVYEYDTQQNFLYSALSKFVSHEAARIQELSTYFSFVGLNQSAFSY